MGYEAKCTLRVGRRTTDGKALLETDELVFRGSFRLVIPYREITDLQVDGGKLFLEFDGDAGRDGARLVESAAGGAAASAKRGRPRGAAQEGDRSARP